MVQSFPTTYVERFLNFLAERVDNSPHLEFYMQWCTQVLVQHGATLKKQSMSLIASIKNLQKSINQKQIDLGRMYVIFTVYYKCASFCYTSSLSALLLHFKCVLIFSCAELTITCTCYAMPSVRPTCVHHDVGGEQCACCCQGNTLIIFIM